MKIRNVLRQISVSQKVALLMVAMLIVAGVNIGVVFYYQSQVAEDSNAVDIAGQQRMLTQQITRYANSVAAGDEQAREPLRASMEKYQSNLEALDAGGTVGETSVPAVPDSARDELQTEQQEWDTFRSNVEVVLNEETGTEGFEAALAEIQDESNGLLSTSDDLVKALSDANSQQIGFMQQLLLVLLVIDLIVFGFGIYVSRAYIGTPLRELDEVAATIAGGDLAADVGEAHSHFGAGSDEIAGLATTVETLRGNVQTRIGDAESAKSEAETAETDAEAARRNAEQAKEDAERLNGHLQEKASSFSETMERAAEGDLTQRMDTDSQSEAMTDIAKVFNEMMDELEETVSQIRSFADKVARSSEEVAGNSEEIERASEQVAESVEEISRGADNQSENLQQVAGEMNDMSATVEEIASSSAEVAATATTAVERGEQGREYASQATAEIQSIEERADKATARVETLEKEVKKIGEVVDMIADIAEQTNILALNASIEAARAGKAGEGFAVVANEIKSLATEAGQATADIESRIETVQATTTETVDGIQQMSDQVERGSKTIEESIEMFDEIADAVQEVEGGIAEISDSTDDQAASSEEVVSMVDQVSSVSQQTAAEASNVSAATEEQTASLSETSAKIQELSELSTALQGEVADFETRTDTATDSGPQSRAATDGGR